VIRPKTPRRTGSPGRAGADDSFVLDGSGQNLQAAPRKRVAAGNLDLAGRRLEVELFSPRPSSTSIE